MTDHPGLTLRVADMADASSLAALSIEVWIGTYLREGVSGFFADYALAELTAARFEMHLANPQEYFIVSQNKIGIDGYIRISRGSPAPVTGCSDVEIKTLYVQPHHHGRGIGAALLRAGLAHCADVGVSDVWLASNAENVGAKGFYLSQGFARVGDTVFVIDDQSYLNDVFARRCVV
ncbi:N-acetyltransferase family protein [Phaeobacter sp. C3_T13_0]|uniref:GNAT family N-acetyltransferase n=1 Tax=Phaeobacter cretensis TaxID=3342641 RepID=UPI0039BC4165